MSGSDQRRRRFYLVGQDFTVNPSGYSLVNREEVLVDGRTGGTHERSVTPGGLLQSFGLPPLRTRPKLIVGLDTDGEASEPLDIYGFGLRYVSSAAKALLQEIAGDAFEFAECDTVDGTGKPIAPYWMTAAIAVVEQIDQKRSAVVTYAERNPEADNAASNPFVVALNDVHFLNVPDELHAFHFLRTIGEFIWDGTLADLWVERGHTGAVLTPLQPPTPRERERLLDFTNAAYWRTRG